MDPNNKYNCIVIDDEYLARKLLTEYIAKFPQLNLIDTFQDPIDAIEIINKKTVDILFLDIEMSEISGLDFIKNLTPENKPLTIFITAYPQYAVKGFELDAFDYIVKPTDFLRFFKSASKAIKELETRTKAQLWEQNQKPDKEYIIVKSERKLIKIHLDDIFFIEGALEYVIFQKETEKITGLYSLKKLEEELPLEKFMRIHKSYIVAVDKITEIEGNQVKVGNHTIFVSKNLRSKLLEVFSK